MDVSAILSSPLLGLVKWAVPQAAGVINFLQAHQQIIASAEPVIRAAVAEGKPAFQAALKEAPQFAQAVKNFVQDHVTNAPHATVGGGGQKVMLENITRAFTGIHRMTPEEEKRWMDNATPGNDPSQENSQRGSG